MRMSAAFPSAYLKATDLAGKRVKIKMDRVEMEDIGGDHKPVLHFIGTDKKMVVNKTNASEIIDAYGDDTDDWHGKTIELYEARVDFQGKKVQAIRVNAMLGGNGSTAPAAQAPAKAKSESFVAEQTAKDAAPFIDDEVPFAWVAVLGLGAVMSAMAFTGGVLA
jgi:hypothetical protein